jgi:class 3 adenylate cyclase/tetratricopeptide (TPR) repeat protein
MKCPECRFKNREGAKFCIECGAEFVHRCPGCGQPTSTQAKFCDECGHDLRTGADAVSKSQPVIEPAAPSQEKQPGATQPLEGERKQITVLFSDLSGYTALSEKLDPEEVKEIMSRIFGEIARVVTEYEGFIEKFIGDAVMALFGVPKAHEDDSIRAIRAAREIHHIVRKISPQYEGKIGRPLFMHTGIHTGLVVTGEIDLGKGTHGVLGDTINVASRLMGLAGKDEILVGHDTYHHAEGYFTFEEREPATVKGKSEAIRVYTVLSLKTEPVTVHRLSGLRARLTGRKAEMTHLQEAVVDLRAGKGSIISIYGDAGTGKSRLVEEFKATLGFDDIQWREGHAYAYTQNIPYFPLIDILSRAFRIEEGDPPDRLREKVETASRELMRDRHDLVPYIGSLYSIRYPEIEAVSPEFWKVKLQEAIKAVLTGLTERAPTIVCLEDLHWADPSSVLLLRSILTGALYPALFLCVYRPTFTLFSSHQLSSLPVSYREIKLQDLSPSDAQEMISSLLRADTILPELRKFIEARVEGNPFYLEEFINNLIETETLVRDNDSWKLTRSLTDADIPTTVQGIISARLDRLENETKRILQEASVIGRAFLYDILKRISELREQIDTHLIGLERLDLIKPRTLQPDLEYIFKHALTQEVVYNGILKKEREVIHEKIGCVIEELFRDRLFEFYEALAFHFKQGQSSTKAVQYLMLAGKKALNRYSLDESHQYYQEAYDMLLAVPSRSREENRLLIDILFDWAYVFYHIGNFRGLADLFSFHVELAESLDDPELLGMFYAWHGFMSWGKGNCRESYDYLHQALRLGEETNNLRVIGYASAWLAFTCTDLGLFDEAIAHGERGQGIADEIATDHYLYFKSRAGLGHACFETGQPRNCHRMGMDVLNHGLQYSDIRCQAVGHILMGTSSMTTGDFQSAIESYHKAIATTIDPFYSQWARCFLASSYVLNDQFEEAEPHLREVLSYSQKYGFDSMEQFMSGLLGIVEITKGNLSQGIKMVEAIHQTFIESERKMLVPIAFIFMGNVYSQIALGTGSITLPIIVKNIGFLARSVPFADKKAEEYFNQAIATAREVKSTGRVAQAFLNLGLLHKGKKRPDKARECLSEAITIFEEIGADAYLQQAQEALTSLE